VKKTFIALAVVFTAFVFGQTIPVYQSRVDLVSATNINNFLSEFEALGVKTTGSIANANTLAWLKNKYTEFGYSASSIQEQNWTQSGYTSKNLIVTKTGTGSNASKFIIVCGHFDTIVGRGTNDNGSGVALILELARILATVPTDYSIKFINFSGEEQGLLGSRAYVAGTLVPSLANTAFILNIDEIGGVTTKANTTVTCESDQTSAGGTANNAPSLAITTNLATYIRNYSSLQTTMSYAYASDYMPFEQKGYVITGLFETNETPHKHSSTDLKSNMDPAYVTNITRGVVGAMQHFAGASTDPTPLSTVSANISERVSLYPNPAQDNVNVGVDAKYFKVFISDLTGKRVLQSENQQNIDISALTNGAYILTTQIGNESVSKKLIVRK